MRITHLLNDISQAIQKKDFRAIDSCMETASKIDCTNHAFAESRFIETGICDGKPYVKKVTESNISNAVDMSDCEDDEFSRSWFYLGDGGVLHPVTIGKQQRFDTDEENPFYFAGSAIVANGKQVGEVVYTDH